MEITGQNLIDLRSFLSTVIWLRSEQLLHKGKIVEYPDVGLTLDHRDVHEPEVKGQLEAAQIALTCVEQEITQTYGTTLVNPSWRR